MLYRVLWSCVSDINQLQCDVTNCVDIIVTVPYLLTNAGLGSKTAYIYAGWAFLTAVWAFFCLPELKVCLIRPYLSVHH
jgi:hypothetical protein